MFWIMVTSGNVRKA